MSGRFVSGGTLELGEGASGADGADGPQPAPAQTQAARQQQGPLAASGRSVEWEAVQKELDEERKQREEARHKAAAGEEKSLYDILQANKAAKQAAFEEQHRLKNQFRALDADEAQFLDEMRERQRRDEDAVRRQTEEGLRAFRERQRSSAAAAAGEAAWDEGAEEWAAPGRKRKRAAREREGIKGVRRRVSAGGSDAEGQAPAADAATKHEPPTKTAPAATAATRSEPAAKTAAAAAATKSEPPAKKAAAAALVDYASDDSDSD